MALAASVLVLVHVLSSHWSRFSLVCNIHGILCMVIGTSKYLCTHFHSGFTCVGMVEV